MSRRPPQVKLIMGIEDPRAAARREQYGVEDESGASRDDVTAALTEVAAGRVPRDRVAFRQLVAELQAWPYLEQEDTIRSDGPSPYAEITETGLSRSERKKQAMARPRFPPAGNGCSGSKPGLALLFAVFSRASALGDARSWGLIAMVDPRPPSLRLDSESPRALPAAPLPQARATPVEEEEELLPEKDLSDFLPKWCVVAVAQLCVASFPSLAVIIWRR